MNRSWPKFSMMTGKFQDGVHPSAENNLANKYTRTSRSVIIAISHLFYMYTYPEGCNLSLTQYARRGTFCRPRRRRQLKGSFTDGHQKLVSSSWSWDSQNRYTGRCAAAATATTTTWPHGYNSKKCANKWVRQGYSLSRPECILRCT